MSKVLIELIYISQETERLLERRFNAKGRGLREKLNSVEKSIPGDLQKKIRLIATTRNLALHGDPREAARKFRDARQAFLEVRKKLDPSAPRQSFLSRLVSFFNLTARVKEFMTPRPGASFPRLQKIVDRLERLLTRYFHAHGVGLHEKFSSVEDKFQEDVGRKIRFIATIRNQAAHENIRVADEKIDAVQKAFEELLPTLDRGATLRKVAIAFIAILVLAGVGFAVFHFLG